MKAIILCAGYATRLYPLTRYVAKSLLPICGVPVLNYIIKKVHNLKDVDEIFVTTNKKFHGQFEEWLKGHGHLYSKKISLFKNSYLLGDKKLGGVDAIERIIKKHKIKDDILVIAGDNLFSYPLTNSYKFFRQKNKTIVILSRLKNRKNASKFGVVEIDGDNKIVSFEEKPKLPKSDLISTAIYFFPRRDLGVIKNYVKSKHKGDSFGYFLKFLYKKEDVYGFVPPKGNFLDIGAIAEFKKAQEVCDGW